MLPAFTGCRYKWNCSRYAFQQFVLLPQEATEFNTLTICVTFGVSPYWSHLNIGLSPIEQYPEEPASIVSLYYYKTFKVEITVTTLVAQRLDIFSLLHD
jgi:hypothetical protein